MKTMKRMTAWLIVWGCFVLRGAWAGTFMVTDEYDVEEVLRNFDWARDQANMAPGQSHTITFEEKGTAHVYQASGNLIAYADVVGPSTAGLCQASCNLVFYKGGSLVNASGDSSLSAFTNMQRIWSCHFTGDLDMEGHRVEEGLRNCCFEGGFKSIRLQDTAINDCSLGNANLYGSNLLLENTEILYSGLFVTDTEINSCETRESFITASSITFKNNEMDDLRLFITDSIVESNRMWGVWIQGSNVTVRGNRIAAVVASTRSMNAEKPSRWTSSTDAPAAVNEIVVWTNSCGLALLDADTITVCNNHIGFEEGHEPLYAAQEYGILLLGAQNITIGGAGAADRNYIGGNRIAGIYGQFSPLTLALNRNISILNNYIGMSAGGATAVPNGHGIRFERTDEWSVYYPTVLDSRIGAPGMGNLIGGNTNDGVSFRGCCSNIVIQGNRIGLAATGAAAAPNGRHGIYTEGYSDNYPVGDMVIGADWGETDPQSGNVIAGNGSNGVHLAGTTLGARLAGNWIGCVPDEALPTGAAGVSNAGWGVCLAGVRHSWVGLTGTFPNVISGNALGGVWVGSSISNTIWNNFIGTGAQGKGNLPNGGDGLCLEDNAQYNTVGGSLMKSANYIGGNLGWGVHLPSRGGGSAYRNDVYGNWIGLAPSGMTYSVNALGGAQIGGMSENRFGGAEADEGNIVDGLIGVRMYGKSQWGLGCRNRADGNIIGFDPFSSFVSTTMVMGIEIGDCLDSVIGSYRGNVIGGAAYAGIHVANDLATRPFAVGHMILNNLIGCATNEMGTMITNLGYGILLEYAGDTQIGFENLPNFVAGNLVGMASFNSVDCTYIGNLVGWDPDGRLIGNRAEGVYFEGDSNVVFGGAAQAEYNAVGGSGSHALRLCSLDGGKVLGNLIGLAPDGDTAATNLGHGVWLKSSTNVVIGMGFGRAPLIAGNAGDGIRIEGAATTSRLHTVVLGCMVGLNASGAAAVPNAGAGVRIVNAASNVIGVALAGQGNFIGGNLGDGIVMEGPLAQGNLVMGNWIGFKTNFTALANSGNGIRVTNAPGNIVGGLITSSGNIIGNNLGCGILAEGAIARNNIFMGNHIGTRPNGGYHGNLLDGVRLLGTPFNMVGSTNEGYGNLIVYNAGNGVFAQDSAEIVVGGNRIGVDWLAIDIMGNLGCGVLFSNTSDAVVMNNTIGDNMAAGIAIEGPSSANNSIVSNRVGTSELDGLDLGNHDDGIRLRGGDRNKIGSCNIIARNYGRGVTIYTGARNTVMGNHIYMNGWESIHVATNGTPGPNMGIRTPIVTNVFAGSTHVRGILQGPPMSVYVLEAFYSWGTNDHGGFAQYPLNQRTNYIAFVGPEGVGEIKMVFERTAPIGSYVVLSATDTNFNTSQYSWPVQVGPAPDTYNYGVPDFYYEDVYTNLSYSQAGQAYTNDYDGDGLSDRDEWIAGTNPENGASNLRLESGSLRIPCTDLGRMYEMERCENLMNQVWTPYTEATGSGSNLVFDIEPAPGVNGEGYRVKVEAP